MKSIPRLRKPDATLAMFRDGYAFISRRCEMLGSDLFVTRILLRKTICMRGREAAALFYDEDRFQRKDAAPLRLQKTLFGRGGVQGLDGEAHRHRKALFLSLMTDDSISRLVRLFAEEWGDALRRWERQDRVALLPEAREMLCRAVCAWAAVPLPDSDVARRTEELGAMIDSPARTGSEHWRGRLLRARAERWVMDLIRKTRAGELEAPEGSALAAVSFHRDLEDRPLGPRVAAVELLNVLRPTVAAARFTAFAGLALYKYPEWRRTFTGGSEEDLGNFVQEVRRLTPFFPFLAARVRRNFAWREYEFPEGTRVLLDLFGTNRDGRIWREPCRFLPERFRSRIVGPFDLIPQGGGDPLTGHRCPGERITIELVKEAVRLLARSMEYDVPPQNMSVSLSRLPASPRSGFVMSSVRACAAGAGDRRKSFGPRRHDPRKAG